MGRPLCLYLSLTLFQGFRFILITLEMSGVGKAHGKINVGFKIGFKVRFKVGWAWLGLKTGGT